MKNENIWVVTSNIFEDDNYQSSSHICYSLEEALNLKEWIEECGYDDEEVTIEEFISNGFVHNSFK